MLRQRQGGPSLPGPRTYVVTTSTYRNRIAPDHYSPNKRYACARRLPIRRLRVLLCRFQPPMTAGARRQSFRLLTDTERLLQPASRLRTYACIFKPHQEAKKYYQPHCFCSSLLQQSIRVPPRVGGHFVEIKSTSRLLHSSKGKTFE